MGKNIRINILLLNTNIVYTYTQCPNGICITKAFVSEIDHNIYFKYMQCEFY